MKILETVKTVLFIGLFISAVTLAGVYIAVQPQEADVGDLPDTVLSALRGGAGSKPIRLSDEQLLPAFLGIKQAGQNAVGLLGSAAMLGDLSEAISPWIAYTLGEESYAETLPAAEGEAFWQACLDSDEYFYLSWRFAVPAALLRAHSLPERADAMLEMASGDLPRVEEIFFFPRSLADYVCAVSRDGQGRVTLWHHMPGIGDNLPDFSDFSIYLERNVLQEYTFVGQGRGDVGSSLSALPIPELSLTLPVLNCSYPFANTDETERVSELLLNLFSYNPNKASGYYEADTDTVVFVETHGTLRASGSALVYEASAQGGIEVADLVRKSSTSLNLRDDLLACEALADQLQREAAEYFGGDADLRLTMVRTEGDALLLTYGYAYDNIDIDADTPALTLTVRDHRIIGANASVCCYRVTDTAVRAGSQAWMLNLAAYFGGEREIALAYTAASDGRSLRADWMLR